MEVIHIVVEIIVAATLIEMMRMVMFQKTWRVRADGTLPVTLNAGKYNVGVVGRMGGNAIRKQDVSVETAAGDAPKIHYYKIPGTGLSSFRAFTKIAAFEIDTSANLHVVVSNIFPSDMKRSRLITWRLLFGGNVKKIEIVISRRLNYIKFLLLILVHLSAFYLLFWLG